MSRVPLQPRPPARAGVLRYALLVLAVALAAIAGYAGYLLYPRFDLPAAAGLGLLPLAAAAGVASFFSPCSFPLLVTLLARQVRPGGRSVAGRALAFAAPFSLGTTAFLLGVGALLGLGGRGLAASVTFTSTAGIAIRAAVGVLLVVLGLIQLGVVRVSFHGVERVTRGVQGGVANIRRRHPAAGAALFGFFYLLIGFG